MVGISREDAQGVTFKMYHKMYQWSHRHFPSFVDCRPIFVRRALEAAGFSVREAEKMSMWVPVEIVSAVNV